VTLSAISSAEALREGGSFCDGGFVVKFLSPIFLAFHRPLVVFSRLTRRDWRNNLMAKITIPDELKQDMPQNKWGKLLAATPIIMTVIATALAGLASSEMTRAQYSRSLGAQQQSKAGDQWGYFQAKRLRGAIQRNTIDILQTTTDLHPLDATALANNNPAPQSATGQQAVSALTKGELPTPPAATPPSPDVQAALSAIENEKPESEILPLVAKLKDKDIGAALSAAQERATAFDSAITPISHAVDQLEKNLSSAGDKSLYRDFVAARLRYTAARYDAEARLNQAIGNLYELQVRKSNIDAERHHQRSQRFFYGMLGAQFAVIVSTFALAARKRNLLWSLAAAAGAAAVGFAAYVYLRM
jgi:hypothetical protein